MRLQTAAYLLTPEFSGAATRTEKRMTETPKHEETQAAGAASDCNDLLAAAPRVVCQFSCGAASAVATKLAIAQYSETHEVIVLNAFLASEHPDNRRFAKDCEKWFGIPLTVVMNTQYNGSVDEVFEDVDYMNGPKGASCSSRLKRQVLAAYGKPGDINVFGFTIEEVDRLMDRRASYPDMEVISPLVEQGLTKEDCKAMVERAGILLPKPYRMGYYNANCIGCVKGGEGYWRAIDEDYPEVYERRMAQEEAIGPGAYLFRNRKTGQRFGLRALRNKPGRVQRSEAMPSCSFFCEAAERTYDDAAANAGVQVSCEATAPATTG